jgi:hypothetical protein
VRAIHASVAASLLVATILASTAARAADERKACVEAFDRAQQLRDQRKLGGAHEQLLSCSRDVCPKVVAKECLAALAEVEKDQPTVTFRARDATGKELADVKVLLDGETLVASLDGRAVAVDPGAHKVRYVHEGAADVEDDVVVRVGEKNRVLDVVFRPPADATPPVVPTSAPPTTTREPSKFHVPVIAWVSLGVGAVGFGAMAVLAATAAGDAQSLRKTCAPSCSAGAVDDVRTRVTLANVGMVVGFVGVGGAILSVVLANTAFRDRGETRSAQVRPFSRWSADVAPQSGGAWASVSTQF